MPNCYATGPGIEAGTINPVVNEPNSFFVQEADQYGNKRSEFTVINGNVAIFGVSFTKASGAQLGRGGALHVESS